MCTLVKVGQQLLGLSAPPKILIMDLSKNENWRQSNLFVDTEKIRKTGQKKKKRKKKRNSHPKIVSFP